MNEQTTNVLIIIATIVFIIITWKIASPKPDTTTPSDPPSDPPRDKVNIHYMPPNKLGLPTKIFFAVVLLLTLISTPYLFSEYRYAGIGNSYTELSSQGISQEMARAIAISEGNKCGLIMVMGQHVPLGVFALIAVGLISKTTSRRFKYILRVIYIATTVVGIPLLAIGLTYIQDNPLSVTLIGALISYAIVSAIVWITVGIGIVIRGKA